MHEYAYISNARYSICMHTRRSCETTSLEKEQSIALVCITCLFL